MNMFYFKPEGGKLINLNFSPLEFASRYSDAQLQVVENYPYLYKLRPNINTCTPAVYFIKFKTFIVHILFAKLNNFLDGR